MDVVSINDEELDHCRNSIMRLGSYGMLDGLFLAGGFSLSLRYRLQLQQQESTVMNLITTKINEAVNINNIKCVGSFLRF